MSDDYGYINARIRAMKSFLLKEEDYLMALRQRSLDEFNLFLSSLPTYSNDFRQIFTQSVKGSFCDELLRLNQCRIFRKIVKFCQGQPQRLILILLTPFDLYNLKTIIRGIIGSCDKDEVTQALIPAGKWDLDFLNGLAKVKDLKALANSLAMSGDEDYLEKEFAQLISDSQDRPLELLENNLEELYFKKAQDYLNPKDMNDRIVLDYLSLQIDFLNILSVLKKALTQPEVTGFIFGGKLKKEFLRDVIQLKSVEDTLKTFERTSYTWLSNEGFDLYKRTQKLSSLERLLKNRLFSFCLNLYIKGGPLSIGIPLAFINFKENEIRNLRLISKAIHFGLPLDVVKEELIYAQ